MATIVPVVLTLVSEEVWASNPNVYQIIFGGMIVLVVLFIPGGLISVMQRPEYAIAKRVPSLFRNIFLAFVVGVLVAMGLVVARTKLAREPLDNPADVEEFRALVHSGELYSGSERAVMRQRGNRVM